MDQRLAEGDVSVEEYRERRALLTGKDAPEAAALEAKIMAEARNEAARILEIGKARIAADVAELRKELDRARPERASQIASRILDREVS